MVSIGPLLPVHREAIEEILRRVEVFTGEELETALEIIDKGLHDSGQEDYLFKVATREDGRALGYICYGRRPLTEGVYDIYWIAVDPSYQGRGVGEELLRSVEEDLLHKGARMVLAETSSNPRFRKARLFYEKNGYKKVARIKDFYRIGDSLVIYQRKLRA